MKTTIVNLSILGLLAMPALASAAEPSDEARLQTLERAYQAGVISKEEYSQKKAQLVADVGGTGKKLETLQQAWEAGIISDEEYARKREHLLSQAGETRTRLQALDEARDAGLLSEEDYSDRRARIMEGRAPSRRTSAPETSLSMRASGAEPGSVAPTGWMLNGATIGRGNTGMALKLGWSEVSVGMLTSVGTHVDLGGTVAFLYGYEGTTIYSVMPGARLNMDLRLSMVSIGAFNLGVKLSPGVVTYFGDSGTAFGVSLPVELVAGFRLAESLSLHVGVSAPMVLFFEPVTAFTLPIRPGVGLEYKVSDALSIGLETGFGPSIQFDYDTVFSFRALMMVGFYL